ncbi:MAG: hypothetical protein AAF921_20485 [Cyanobacteria bacterium P01_D01_bin.44]
MFTGVVLASLWVKQAGVGQVVLLGEVAALFGLQVGTGAMALTSPR